MPKFRYEAVDRAGASITGTIESGNEDAVVAELSNAGLTPLSVAADRPAFQFLHRRQALATEQEAALLTRKLAALLQAGLTLDRALVIVRDLSGESPQRRLVEELLQRIKAGMSLSDALTERAELFAPDYVGMIRAGEFSGALPQTLARLAQMLERRLQLRQRLASTLTYPLILLGMMVLTVVIVVTVVLPRMESLFAEAQAALPLATRAVLACGHFLQDYGWMLLASILIATAATVRALKHPALRMKIDRGLIHGRPGQLFAAMEFARFSRVLGTLIGGGVALPTAFRLALPSVRNTALLEDLTRALARVREGSALADELSRVRATPAILSSLASVGMQTGQLDRMLIEAADLLDSEVNGLTERYLALLVPTLTIVMGLLVAGLIASVLVGILSVNDLAL